MSEDIDRLDPLQSSAALKRLAEHLIALDTQGNIDIPMESDMLSLIVSGTLNGENIRDRYPAFHRKLLEHADLRQAFLDVLESIEAEQAGQQILMPDAARNRLSFLETRPTSPVVEIDGENNWRTTLQRSLEQLESIFSPQQLVYRADPELIEDPWFTLAREEVNVVGASLDVTLECSPSVDSESALSTFLNLAVTVESPSQPARFPLRATLQWGEYHASILILEEGRIRFPDVPMTAIFDEQQAQLGSGIQLVLETVA